ALLRGRLGTGGLALVRQVLALLGRHAAAGRGLGLGARSEDHDHVTAVLLRCRLDDAELSDLLLEPTQEPVPQLRAALLASAEHDRHLDLVALLQEPHHVTLLGLVVVRVDLRPELHLLDDGLLLVTPGLARLDVALVLELAKVHELAHRRAGHRRDLDQIQIHVAGQLQSALQGHDAYLLALRADQPDLPSPDLLVDAWFDADGASSSQFQVWRPTPNERPRRMPGPARPVAAKWRFNIAAGGCFPRGGPDPAAVTAGGWERAAPLGTLRAVRGHRAVGRL